MHFDNKVVIRTDILARRVASHTILWPDGWMDEDATWYRSRPPRWPHSIRRVPSAPRKAHSILPLLGSCLLSPMSIVATVAHLSYCWALVFLENSMTRSLITVCFFCYLPILQALRSYSSVGLYINSVAFLSSSRWDRFRLELLSRECP